MKALWIVLGVLGAMVLAVALVFFNYEGTRNQMFRLSTATDNAFSEMDVQMQRRADLIPNLVATVKGFAKQEQTVFDDIAKARNGLLQAQTPDEKNAANSRLDVALLPLMRMQEAYPQLKSNEQFERLEDELSGTENRIGVARKRYNDSVTEYNNYIGVFPHNIWAGMGSPVYAPKKMFEATAAGRETPKVDFSN
jgi:LemA protein